MDQDEDKKVCLLSETEAVRAAEKSNKEKRGVDNGEKYRFLSFQELPDYMKDNEYILNYYRVNWPLKEAFFSLFRWHNETLNVWTHLLGFSLFVGLTLANIIQVPHVADFISIIYEKFQWTVEAHASRNVSMVATYVVKVSEEANKLMERSISSAAAGETRWPFYVFLGGAMWCLLCSTSCHLFSCHSRRLSLHLLRLDYVGITVMIITSFFPPVYYTFQCTPHWQILYLSAISAMGLCTIAALLSPSLSAPRFRLLRAALFVSMGLFALFPTLHALLILNWNDPHRHLILAYESAMALSYLVGTLFYVARVPERWGPGRFDLAGHSHQIFHVFVLIGALAHYAAARLFLSYRSRTPCAAVLPLMLHSL